MIDKENNFKVEVTTLEYEELEDFINEIGYNNVLNIIPIYTALDDSFVVIYKVV